MGNCIRTEMWKAFHNKMMRSALLIGFILVIADLVQTAITVSDLGASYAHSPGGYDGCSLFVNWIGVNGVTVGAVVFYAVWPFLAAMPYGWSLYEDNRSHMTNNILTRVPYSQYLTAKMAAVFVSGGIAIALPVTTDLFASAMVCPACIPRVALPITGFCSGTAFLAKLYYTHPWLHAIIWCVIEFFWGGVAASLCIIVGHRAPRRAWRHGIACPACSSRNVRWPYGSPTFHDSPQRGADLGQLTGSFFQTDDLHLAHVGEDGEPVDVAADALELAE